MGGDNKLSDYRIREALNVVCVDDDQDLRWAAGFLEHHLGAEVTHGKRKVGWITTSDKEKAASLIKAGKLRSADGAAPDDAVMRALG